MAYHGIVFVKRGGQEVVVNEFVPARAAPLSKVYYSAEHQFSLRYPENWTVVERPKEHPDVFLLGTGPAAEGEERENCGPGFIVRMIPEDATVWEGLKNSSGDMNALHTMFANELEKNGGTVHDVQLVSIADEGSVLVEMSMRDIFGIKKEFLQNTFFRHGLALGLLDVPEYFEQNRPVLESIMASIRFGAQAERE